MSDLSYLVAFHQTNLAPSVLLKLIKSFGSAEKIWKADKSEFVQKRVDQRIISTIFNIRKRIDPTAHLATLSKKDIQVITIFDKSYPRLLKEISSPPVILYYRGEIKPKDNLAIAVVGSRKATSYGRQVTESLVSQLVLAGLTIVSGMARGIDSVAHQAALSAGGRTLAVLGCGVDVVYPAENKKLYEKISQNGAVISEFSPGTKPERYNFPTRNRIIAGLSVGVLVTEAAADSGSLITAGLAADFGREVFAVAGPIYSKMSEGTANLIKDGAKLVYKLDDILEELKLEVRDLRLEVSKKTKSFDEVEGKILEILEREPAHVDQIIKELNLKTAEVSSKLTLLEIGGLIKNLGGGMYTVRKQ